MKRSPLGLACVFATTMSLAACGGPAARPPPVAAPEPREVTDAPCDCQWVHMPMSIFFGPGSSEVEPDFNRNGEGIQSMAASLAARDDIVRVRVEGHTGWCEPERREGLSEARARAVETELRRLGVPAELLTSIGYGNTQPRKSDAMKEQADPCTQEEHAAGRVAWSHRVELSVRRCRRTEHGVARACPDQPDQPARRL